jgi:hypothetical protein
MVLEDGLIDGSMAIYDNNQKMVNRNHNKLQDGILR